MIEFPYEYLQVYEFKYKHFNTVPLILHASFAEQHLGLLSMQSLTSGRTEHLVPDAGMLVCIRLVLCRSHLYFAYVWCANDGYIMRQGNCAQA